MPEEVHISRRSLGEEVGAHKLHPIQEVGPVLVPELLCLGNDPRTICEDACRQLAGPRQQLSQSIIIIIIQHQLPGPKGSPVMSGWSARREARKPPVPPPMSATRAPAWWRQS